MKSKIRFPFLPPFQLQAGIRERAADHEKVLWCVGGPPVSPGPFRRRSPELGQPWQVQAGSCPPPAEEADHCHMRQQCGLRTVAHKQLNQALHVCGCVCHVAGMCLLSLLTSGLL